MAKPPTPNSLRIRKQTLNPSPSRVLQPRSSFPRGSDIFLASSPRKTRNSPQTAHPQGVSVSLAYVRLSCWLSFLQAALPGGISLESTSPVPLFLIFPLLSFRPVSFPHCLCPLSTPSCFCCSLLFPSPIPACLPTLVPALLSQCLMPHIPCHLP